MTFTAEAQERRLDGYFIARSACPAFQSMRRGTNPGNVMTEVDRAYDLLSQNNTPPSHYRVIIKSAQPKERWVAVSCGERVMPVAGPMPPGGGPRPLGGGQPPRPGQAEFVLAASWQPGFCETRPSKPECVSQNGDRFDADHFALHGLWPQPRSNVYCNVSAELRRKDKDRRWAELPALQLSAETRETLDKVMPGSQSFLHRHEWIKHGTCYQGAPAEEYFADSLLLMADLNASAVRTLFAQNIGSEVTNAQIRAAFDTAFGAGAGDRIRVACKRDGARQIITEITIGLSGEIAPGASFADLIRAAPASGNTGCPRGIVDPVGLQ